MTHRSDEAGDVTPASGVTSADDGRRPTPAGALWTREFITALVVNMMAMLIFYLLMTTLALYAAERFMASDSMAGLASSMFIIGAVAGRLVAGALMSRGPRRVLLWSLVVFVAMSAAYLVAGSLALLLVIRFVHGVAFGLASTAVTTIAQSIIPPPRRGEGTGYFTVGAPLAGALGPLLGLALLTRWDHDALFLASIVISAIACAITLLLDEHPVGTAQTIQRLSWRRIVDRDALPVATVALWVGVANAAVIAFTHPFTVSVGIGSAAGTYFGIQSAAVLASRLVVGRLQDRFGASSVVYPALLLNAGGIALLGQATAVPVLVLSAVLTGLGFGSITPAIQAVAVTLAQPHNIGLAVATFFLLLDIGTGFGPPVLGLIVGAWGYPVMFLFVAGLVLLSAGQYHLVHGRLARRRPS